jgi:phage terminase large subunit-like protein
MTTTRIGLLKACDDSRLLGAGISLFPRQREILDALDTGPWRMLIAALGRRSGKTHMAGVAMVHNALLRPDLDAMVRPGELRYVAAIATNREQAKIVLRVARDIIDASPLLRPCVLEDRDDQITLRTASGGLAAITAFPCTSRGIRGRPISLLVLDEAAHFLDSDGNASDYSVMQAALPSLLQFGDAARVLMISTPAGTANMFAHEFQRAVSGEEPTARAWQLPSVEVNPQLDPDWLAAEERRDPDYFRSEYLAQFVGGTGAFFDFDRFEIGDYVERPPEDSHQWAMGVDVALQKDPFAAVVVGRDWRERSRLWVGSVQAWTPPSTAGLSFEAKTAATDELFERAIGLARRFSVRRVFADQYLNRAVADRFSRASIGTTVVGLTRDTKYQAFAALRAALYSGELLLPDVPELLGELRQVRIKHAGAGSSIETPRTATGHCDRAVALAIVTWELTRHGVGTGRGRFGLKSGVQSGDGDLSRGWAARVSRENV